MAHGLPLACIAPSPCHLKTTSAFISPPCMVVVCQTTCSDLPRHKGPPSRACPCPCLMLYRCTAVCCLLLPAVCCGTLCATGTRGPTAPPTATTATCRCRRASTPSRGSCGRDRPRSPLPLRQQQQARRGCRVAAAAAARRQRARRRPQGARRRLVLGCKGCRRGGASLWHCGILHASRCKRSCPYQQISCKARSACPPGALQMRWAVRRRRCGRKNTVGVGHWG